MIRKSKKEVHGGAIKGTFKRIRGHKKGEPTHGIYHKIEAGSHAPCTTKRRPIIIDSAKAAAGKAAWKQMERDGVIERVQADTNTDFSSVQFSSAVQLPLLKDFTGRIHGSKVFSAIDLRSAFFNVIWPEHRHKTLTLSPWGSSFIYNRLAFGLASGPSTWQKLLEHGLGGIDNSEKTSRVMMTLSKKYSRG